MSISKKQQVNLDFILTFGKHKNKKLSDLYKKDPQYLMWLIRNDILNIEKGDLVYRLCSIFILHKRYKKRNYKQYPLDPEFDAAFASCYDWGSQ